MTGTVSPARRRARAEAVLASERDLRLLRMIGEQYALTLPQLARAAGRSEHTARWLRARWQREGWLDGRVLVVGWPVFVWLSARGTRVAGLELKTWRPTALGRLAHLGAVTDVRLLVEQRRPEATWLSERVICQELLRGSHRRRHLPDAEVVVGDKRVAVEVELTTKQRNRAERIAAELLGSYDAIWYFAPPDVRRQLEAIVARNGWRRVQVHDLPAAEDER